MTPTPKLPELISGALFDFLGFLTTLGKGVTFGASHEATPAVKLLSEWAAKRGLELDEARVRDWSESLAQPSPGAVQDVADKLRKTGGYSGSEKLLRHRIAETLAAAGGGDGESSSSSPILDGAFSFVEEMASPTPRGDGAGGGS
jgi:hypothetical protein